MIALTTKFCKRCFFNKERARSGCLGKRYIFETGINRNQENRECRYDVDMSSVGLRMVGGAYFLKGIRGHKIGGET